MYLSNISNVINRRPNEYSAKQTPMNSLLEQWLRVRRPDAETESTQLSLKEIKTRIDGRCAEMAGGAC